MSSNLKLFISLLPKFKQMINKYENPSDLSLNSILALMAHIILLTGIRAGKEFHRQRSNSYGLTSLRRKHIEIMENKRLKKTFIRLSFIILIASSLLNIIYYPFKRREKNLSSFILYLQILFLCF